jgi:hypothetical protein
MLHVPPAGKLLKACIAIKVILDMIARDIAVVWYVRS